MRTWTATGQVESYGRTDYEDDQGRWPDLAFGGPHTLRGASGGTIGTFTPADPSRDYRPVMALLAAAPALAEALREAETTLDAVANLFGAATQGTAADTLAARKAVRAALALIEPEGGAA